jgi:peptidyl-prolyl cis-trans isomerase SurA
VLVAMLLCLGVAALAPATAGAQTVQPAATAAPARANTVAPAAVRSTARANLRSGDYIVAVVNSELVTSVELNQRLERVQADARRAGAKLPDEATLRQQILDGLIDERVQVTHAREAGVRVDEAEVDRAVANVAAQNQLTVAQLRERLRADGMDYVRFRLNLRDQLMVERVREREVIARIRVNDDEVDKLLQEQQAQQGGEPQINLAQILVTVPEGASAQVLAEREARVAQALARLRAGEDFAQVARALSEDANREAGGEIGLRPASRLPDLFLEASRALSLGAYTPNAVRSGAGFHLLKLIDRQQPAANKVRQARVRHILLRVPEGGSPDAVVQRMEEVRRQIERGEQPFETIARRISEDGSAAEGGDLGWASVGQFVPEFEQAMAGLAPGSVSAPVVSRFGVHLIQVQERREVDVDPALQREQARGQLREQKFEPAYLEWVKELRLRAFIELREPPL